MGIGAPPEAWVTRSHKDMGRFNKRAFLEPMSCHSCEGRVTDSSPNDVRSDRNWYGVSDLGQTRWPRFRAWDCCADSNLRPIGAAEVAWHQLSD
eukprot:COSAG01_NODE_230_length_21075_cov_13.811603_18_plen_94_part_00